MEQCVMTTGTIKMPLLYAPSLDSLAMVKWQPTMHENPLIVLMLQEL